METQDLGQQFIQCGAVLEAALAGRDKVPAAEAAKALRDGGLAFAADVLDFMDRALRGVRPAYVEQDEAADPQWPVERLMALLDWRRPPKFCRYLPLFEPVARVLETLCPQEVDASCDPDALIARLHALLDRRGVTEPGMEGLFVRFGKSDLDARLQAHLVDALLLRRFRALPGDQPLADYYVEPVGAPAETFDPDQSIGMLPPAAELLEELYALKQMAGLPAVALVYGAAGAGKSSFLRMRAADQAKQYLEARKGFIPFHFSLQSVRGRAASLAEVLASDSYALAGRTPCWLFLDGLEQAGPVKKGFLEAVFCRLEAILAGLPAGSRATVSVRTPGLDDPKGQPLMRYLRSRLGRALLLPGLRPGQADELFRRRVLSGPGDWTAPSRRERPALTAEGLARLGLAETELKLPFFAWLTDHLAGLDRLDVENRTGLGRSQAYAAFAEFFSRVGRPRGAESEDQGLGVDWSRVQFSPLTPEQRLLARYYLRRLALAKPGATMEEVWRSLSEDEQAVLEPLRELELPALVRAGTDGERAGFVTASVRHYFMAEETLARLLRAAALRLDGRADAGDLPDLPELGEEGALFFLNLCRGLARPVLPAELLVSVAQGCPALQGRLGSAEGIDPDLQDEVIAGPLRWLGADAPESVLALAPQARWLELLAASVLSLELKGEPFFRRYGAVAQPGRIAALLRLTPRPPLWARRLLTCADLRGARLARFDLRQARLKLAELAGADLREAALAKADLTRANLSQGRLSGADLRQAVLEGAVLRQADLGRCDLRGAKLAGACLRRADLRGADLRGADFHEADLSGALLDGALMGE